MKRCGSTLVNAHISLHLSQLDRNILPYIHPIMAKFMGMLQSGSRTVQELVLVTLGSIAVAAEKEFLPYFPGTMQVLEHCMTLTDEDNILLRCRATECIGVIAIGVGKEAFAVRANFLPVLLTYLICVSAAP